MKQAVVSRGRERSGHSGQKTKQKNNRRVSWSSHTFRSKGIYLHKLVHIYTFTYNKLKPLQRH